MTIFDDRKKENTSILPEQKTAEIEGMILNIRGQQVMLDRDLAKLYGVEIKRLNEQVKRNIERFPEDFMFQLTKEECLRSQIATLNTKQGEHRKYLPFAFTENGVAMLSSVLRSKTAISVNIKIMRAFVAMRRFIASNLQLFQRLSNIEYHQIETDKRIDEVFKKLDAHLPSQQGIFYDGQVFDAYSFISELVRMAHNTIILIDNYVDDSILKILDKRNKGVKATIFTSKINSSFNLDIRQHNAQYPAIEVRLFKRAHDRFLIIDDDVYLIGASLKDLGKKWFGFTLMKHIKSEEIIERLSDSSASVNG